jgi:hypothetical protein
VRRLILVYLFFGLSLQSCAPVAPRYNPFKISREEFFTRARVVAIAPLVLAVNPADPEATRTQFESLIDQKLRALGFTVIASNEYKHTRERLIKQLGGIFDPITGKPDESKAKTLRSYLLEELRTKHRADAVLYPMVQVVKAGFNAGQARWHGTGEPVLPEGFWAQFTMGDLQGTTSAASLLVRIEDINGADLYLQAGGIQVLAKLASGRQFVSIPQQELLTNADRNKAAVDIALGALSKEKPAEDARPGAP